MLTTDNLNHAERLKSESLRTLADAGSARSDRLIQSAAGIEFDATKQRLDVAALEALIGTARAAGIEEKRDALLSGAIVNGTEQRPALHMAYRHGADISGSPEAELVDRTQAQTRAFADAVRTGDFQPSGKPITRVINIGIGGSDLGPRLVADALADHAEGGPELRFVASLDPSDLKHAVAGCDPEAVLFIIASKSFSTQETLMTGEAARDWLAGEIGADKAGDHFAAASAAPDKAKAFGLDPERVFDFPDWVAIPSGRRWGWPWRSDLVRMSLPPSATGRAPWTGISPRRRSNRICPFSKA